MHRESIVLSDIETIKRFVAFANRFEFPVTLFSDKYTVNGKSIMGIFGLDLTKPVEIEVDETSPSEFKEQLRTFQVSPAEAFDIGLTKPIEIEVAETSPYEFKEHFRTFQVPATENVDNF